MNPANIGLVIAQEFRIRLRTGKWRWLLAIWVVVLALFTMLLDLSLQAAAGSTADPALEGIPLFGVLMFFVLTAMLVISPALAAQNVNGDRERGTLATLQVTRLRPFEIACGKLLAAWSVGLVALALSLPFAGYAIIRGGIPIVRMIAVYGVVALLIGTVCAVAQAFSALFARTITSALLSYIVTAVFTIGTVISFALAVPLTSQLVTVHPRPYEYNNAPEPFVMSIERPEEVWWLLAANPFVIVADAAPRVPPKLIANRENQVAYQDNDPLSALGREVRQLRLRRWYYSMESDGFGGVHYYDYDGKEVYPPKDTDLPVWPYGLGFFVLLGAASLTVTTLRLAAPAKRLAKGVRVA